MTWVSKGPYVHDVLAREPGEDVAVGQVLEELGDLDPGHLEQVGYGELVEALEADEELDLGLLEEALVPPEHVPEEVHGGHPVAGHVVLDCGERRTYTGG